MTFIEVIGHIDNNGKLELPADTKLPPGEVRIIIESFDAETEAADEALWQQQFAESPDKLDFLINEGLAALDSGEAEDFDPDID